MFPQAESRDVGIRGVEEAIDRCACGEGAGLAEAAGMVTSARMITMEIDAT